MKGLGHRVSSMHSCILVEKSWTGGVWTVAQECGRFAVRRRMKLVIGQGDVSLVGCGNTDIVVVGKEENVREPS